ncbi:hypothetical protein ACFE04_018720 [Oxalis oulophora]
MASEINNELINGDEQEQTNDDTYDGLRAVRHSRWSKRETVILLEGKKLIESQMKEGYRSDKLEPKWDSVASFCQSNRVSRGAAQCRKRWSNLLGDFRKIRSWESGRVTNPEVESFWTMRNDFKKEKKLPSSFDRDIYDIMDGKQLPFPLTTYQATGDTNKDGDTSLDDDEPPQDGMFPETEQHEKEETEQSTEKETLPSGSPTNMQGGDFPITGADKVKSPSTNTWTGSSSQDGRKRKRMSSERYEDEKNLENQLIKILEKNNNMLCAQLEAQNKNLQEDRIQMKEHTDRVVGALNKLTEVLTKVAEKLELTAQNK